MKVGRPLDDIKVLDCSIVVAGPICTLLLADMGAEVIKIEMPGVGDPTRNTGPFPEGIDEEKRIEASGHFLGLNRMKKSLTLNLKTEKGKKIFLDLAKICDVIVENFRPGVMDRLGLGYDVVKEINPRVVYTSISGFGHSKESPYWDRPAFDVTIQAMSGVMSITGPPDEPTKFGPAIGDIMASVLAAYAIMVALRSREKTGRGQYIDIAMYDSCVFLNERTTCVYTITKKVQKGGEHPLHGPYGVFKTKDGHIVFGVYPSNWPNFCKGLGREDLVDDPRFSEGLLRAKNNDLLKPIIENFTAKMTKAEVVEHFSKLGVPTAPVQDIEDVFHCPHIKARNMLVEVDHPVVGKVTLYNTPIRLSDMPLGPPAPAPLLGQHNEEILYGLLGYSHKEIEQLKKDGVI